MNAAALLGLLATPATSSDGRTLLLVALIAAVPVVYTAYSTRQAAEKSRAIERDKVDAESFRVAREIDRETISALRSDLDLAQRQVQALRRDLSDEQRESLRLREHIDRLEATVARLRARLAVAGLIDDRKDDTE